VFLNFQVARDGFLANAQGAPCVSCKLKLGRFGQRIEPEDFFPLGFQEQCDRVPKVLKAILACLALSVGARNFKTGGPKTALVYFAAMDDGCELPHIGQGRAKVISFKAWLESLTAHTARQVTRVQLTSQPLALGAGCFARLTSSNIALPLTDTFL
jgi:hypothetical protein